MSTATRASSPIRPGSTAFPNSPTQKAENVSEAGGCGGGIDCLITVRHANERTTTESRLSAIAPGTHSHRTAWNASPTTCQSGPRNQSSATTTPRPAG